MSALVAFYSGEGRDVAGRAIEDIWAWDDDRLEYVHDFIQWLFPLAAPSMANHLAPLLTEADIQAFRHDERLRARLLMSFERMVRFYGLQLRRPGEDGLLVEEGPDFQQRQRIWVRPYNHNHLRLTRIMTSLAVLGAADEARALQRFLLALAARHPGDISPATVEYWRSAVGV